MDNQASVQETAKTKFCKHCGARIPEDAVLCTACGRQVEEAKQNASASQPNIVINNANANTNVNQNVGMPGYMPTARNKWVALLLWLFLGFVGAHKFYEHKVGMGILYIFTAGLFGIGWAIDFFVLLFKPTIYYVR